MNTQTQGANLPNVSTEYARRRRRSLTVGWGSFVLLTPIYAAYYYAGPANSDLVFWLSMLAVLPITAYQLAIWRCPNCRHFLSFSQRNYFAKQCPRCRASFQAGAAAVA